MAADSINIVDNEEEWRTCSKIPHDAMIIPQRRDIESLAEKICVLLGTEHPTPI